MSFEFTSDQLDTLSGTAELVQRLLDMADVECSKSQARDIVAKLFNFNNWGCLLRNSNDLEADAEPETDLGKGFAFKDQGTVTLATMFPSIPPWLARDMSKLVMMRVMMIESNRRNQTEGDSEKQQGKLVTAEAFDADLFLTLKERLERRKNYKPETVYHDQDAFKTLLEGQVYYGGKYDISLFDCDPVDAMNAAKSEAEISSLYNPVQYCWDDLAHLMCSKLKLDQSNAEHIKVTKAWLLDYAPEFHVELFNTPTFKLLQDSSNVVEFSR